MAVFSSLLCTKAVLQFSSNSPLNLGKKRFNFCKELDQSNFGKSILFILTAFLILRKDAYLKSLNENIALLS